MSRESAAIGIRVRTGRGIAVLVAGTKQKPRLVERRDVQLHDPAVPHSGQPYHVALEIGDEAAAPLEKRALECVRKLGRRELEKLCDSVAKSGHSLRGVGLVVGSLGDPEKLGNPHVRAHAREGQLYWQVLDAAARALGVPCSVTTEKDIYDDSVESLRMDPDELRKALTELGKTVGRPWSAYEKTATLAAWSKLK